MVISTWPRTGYRYYDEYCGTGFRNLDIYLDHLYGYDHPAVIQVLDGYGNPVASCNYRDGSWVVIEAY